MALAPFFDKTALAAAALLHGFDRDGFVAMLESQVVAIAFDDQAAGTFEGRTTLELSTNLLARLYPRIALAPVGVAAADHARLLADQATAINPAIEIVTGAASATACVAVGATRVDVPAAPVIYIGSDGWVVEASATTPVGSGRSENPIGAAAAACFGAANLFRVIFSEQLTGSAIDTGFRMSLIDLDPGNSAPPNPSLEPVGLDDAHLVGAGAIGNGAVWVLSRAHRLTGRLHVVDGEEVDGTNVQRYVLTTPLDQGVPKVEIAAREFAGNGSSLEVRRHRLTWGEYLAGLSAPWRLGLVGVALDSAADRIAVQAALPSRIVNAWTQAGDLGISRHDFLGDYACLACLYLPESRGKNEDELVAEAIGLPERRMQVRQLLYTGAPAEEGLVREIAIALSVPVEPLLPFAGRPLRTFYSEAICGGIVLGLQGGGDRRGGTEVPMAFQSTLAGILLAAGVVAEAAHLPAPAGTKAVFDLLRPMGEHLTVPVAKHASGRCICEDADFQAVYRSRH